MAQTVGYQDLNSPQNQQGQQGQQQQGQQQQGQTQPVQAYNPSAQRGSGYTNIQRVLQANVGNQLGQAVGGGIQQQAQQTQSGIQQAGQQFEQASQAANIATPERQQALQQILQDPTKYFGQNIGQDQMQQAAQAQQLVAGQYGGPTQLQNLGQLQSQVGAAQQLGQAVTSAGGQQALLQRFLGAPQYQAGQQAFDVALLGATGTPQLQAARRATFGLGRQLTGQETAAEQQAQQLTSQAQQAGQQAQQQLGQTITGEQTQLQQQAQQAQAARDAQVQALLQGVQSGQLTQAQADQLGLQAGQGLFNIGSAISNYLQEDPLKATAQNIASTQDYAKLAALGQLGGQYTPEQAAQVLQQFKGQQAQAGQFQATPGFEFNKGAFLSDVDTQQQQYQQAVTPIQQLLAQRQAQRQQELEGGIAQTLGNIVASSGGPMTGSLSQTLSMANLNLSPAQQQEVQNAFKSSTGLAGGGGGGWKSLSPETQQAIINSQFGQQQRGQMAKYWDPNYISGPQAQLAALAQQYGAGNILQIIPDQSQTQGQS